MKNNFKKFVAAALIGGAALCSPVSIKSSEAFVADCSTLINCFEWRPIVCTPIPQIQLPTTIGTAVATEIIKLIKKFIFPSF